MIRKADGVCSAAKPPTIKKCIVYEGTLPGSRNGGTLQTLKKGSWAWVNPK